MSAQLVINNTVIDLPEEVTYNFKIGDIGQINLSKSSYTTTFNIGRTAEVVKLFKGLGIAGDRSDIPYTITNVMLMDDYTPLLRGTLVVVRTDAEYYNVTVVSGAYDFFNEIGDTKFSDIDISEIWHDKNLSTVKDNIDGLILNPYGGNFTYAMAHFGHSVSHYQVVDPNTEEILEPRTVNIDALVPFVTAKYLWDKIFGHFSMFTFSGDFYTSADFEALWVGFPYGSFKEVGEAILDADVYKRGYVFSGSASLTSMTATYAHVLPEFMELESPARQRIYALEDGYLRLNIEKFQVEIATPSDITMTVIAWKNGTEELMRIDATSEANIENMGSVDVWLDEGDFIGFTLIWTGGGPITGEIIDFTANLSKITFTQNSADKVFGLSIKTFISEIMWRYGLVSIVQDGHIHFENYSDIINSSTIIDWSSKYSQRVEEEYTLGYAQNNWLRHKYDEEDVEYNDKNLTSSNDNLPPSKTLKQSEFYSPLRDKTGFTTAPEFTIQVDEWPIFNGEKIQNRLFFANIGVFNYPYRIGSATMRNSYFKNIGSDEFPNALHVATFDGVAFKDLSYFNALSKIMNNTRAHTIELLLTTADVTGLDLTAVYYFEQEQSYYILNSLKYTKEELAVGEFIKLN